MSTHTRVRRARRDDHEFEIQVTTLSNEDIADDLVERAGDHIATLAAHLRRPVLFARVKLDRSKDPAVAQPFYAEGSMDVDGSIMRAAATGSSMKEAVDRLRDRLQQKIERAADRENRQADGMTPLPGEWRHENLPAVRVPFMERPAEEREIVRRKVVTSAPMALDDAVWQLVQSDYDFWLFRDLETDRDALVRRTSDGTAISYLDSQPDAIHPTLLEGTTVEQPPATLTAEAAVDWLDATNDRHVFFADAATGRGAVLYRRRDGHFGLLGPLTG